MHRVRLSNFVDEISLSGGGCKVSKFSFIVTENYDVTMPRVYICVCVLWALVRLDPFNLIGPLV